MWEGKTVGWRMLDVPDELALRRSHKRKYPRLSVLINSELRDLLCELMGKHKIGAGQLVNLAFGMLKFLMEEAGWILLRVNEKTGDCERFTVSRAK